MRKDHLWNRAKDVKIQISPDIAGNFDVGFDWKIPEEVRDALMKFVCWVENHFYLPVTLWVDFKYNHYLIDQNGKRVGYKFYWAEFDHYPVFTDADNLPMIALPVRTEHWTMEEILASFIEAISLYYLWLTNSMTADIEIDAREVEEVLQAYLSNQEE